MLCPSCGVSPRPMLEHKITCIHRQQFFGTPPFITALCPTYQRPKTLASILAQWQAMQYPPDRCELIVLDDAGQYPNLTLLNHRYGDKTELCPQGELTRCPGYRLYSEMKRYPSLVAKYQRMYKLVNPQTEAIVLLDDDDVYLPHHLALYAEGFRLYGTVKPSVVLTTYAAETGSARIEQASGRFHGSLGLTVDKLKSVGFWDNVEADRADFDQQFIALLTADKEDVYAPAVTPSYIFRWNTGQPHVQSLMKNPNDTTWYARYAGLGNLDYYRTTGIRPELDDEAKVLIEKYQLP